MEICQNGRAKHIFAKTVEEYLEKKALLDPDTGCLNWQGAENGWGYGSVHKLKWGVAYKVTGAHMLAWIVRNGDYDRRLFVCHKCDNPKCINTEHLFLGTPKDNTQDMISKGRQAVKNHHGENNPRCKLNRFAVQFIKDTVEVYSAVKLAQIFGVTDQHIRNIRTGKIRF